MLSGFPSMDRVTFDLFQTALIQMPGLIDTIILQMALDSEEMQQVCVVFAFLVW